MSDSTPPNRRTQSAAVSPQANRHQEKAELGHLNSRLERVIQAVRDLEDKKRRAEDELRKAQQQQQQQGSKKTLEDRINNLQKEIEAAQRDKALKEHQLKKIQAEVAEVEGKVNKMAQEKEAADKKLVTLQKKVPEQEEQIGFLSKLHEDELKSLRADVSVRDQEIDGLKTNLDGEVAKEREKARKDWTVGVEKERAAISARNKAQLGNLERDLGNVKAEGTNLKGELAAIRAESASIREKHKEAEAENKRLREEIGAVQKASASQSAELQRQIASIDDDVRKAQEALKTATDDIQELTSDNFRLDTEITDYRRMVAGEEARLKLSPKDAPPSPPPYPASPPASSGSGSGSGTSKKRKFEDLEEPPQPRQLRAEVTKSGIVNIEECNIDSQHAKVVNMTKEDIFIENWWIQAGTKAGENPKHRFKFPAGTQLPADGSYIVRIRVSHGEELEADPTVLTFDQSLVAPGSYLSLYNEANEVISTLGIIEREGEVREGDGSRITICPLM